MSTQALQVVGEFYRAIENRDPAAAEATLAHDTLSVVEADSLPYGGTYLGIDGFRALMRQLGTTWKGSSLQDVHLAVNGSRVFAHFTFSATARGTGQPVAFPVIEMLEVSQGKIVSIRPFYWDTHAVRAALGLAG